MPKVSKPCAGCGATFESWPNHQQKFCGRACSNKHGNAGRKVGDTKNHAVLMSCEHCGDNYQRWPSQIGKGNYKYCSRSCANLARRDRRTFNCETCGAERTVKAGNPARFCTSSCSRVALRKSAVKRRVARGVSTNLARRCKQCGVAVPPQRLFCSRACNSASQDTRVVIPCAACGLPVRRTKAVVAKVRRVSCSYACSRQVQETPSRESKIGRASIDLWAASEDVIWEPEFRFGRYRIDLAVPLEMIAVELDGEYWHSRPEVIARDAKKAALLQANGWALRRIVMSAHDTPETVAAQIAKAVRSARREQRQRARSVA